MNQREKIMDLVKQGVITTEEAIILLENDHKESKNSDNYLDKAKKVEEKISATHAELDMLESLELIAPLTDPQKERVQELENEMHRLKDERDSLKDDQKESNANDRQDKWKNVKNEAVNQANDLVQQMGHILKRTGDHVQNYLKEASERQKEYRTPKFFDKIYTFEAQQLDSLYIEASSASFNLKSWDENKIKVVVHGKFFTLDEDLEKLFLEKTQLSVHGDEFILRCLDKSISAHFDIYLPQQNYGHVSIKTEIGDIIMDAFQMEDAMLRTIHGNILLKQIDAVMLETYVTNGEIKVQNSSIRELVADSVNGSIQVNGSVVCSQIVCTNGNITMRNYSKEIDEMSYQTVNGNIFISVQPKLPFAMTAATKYGKIHHHLSDFEILKDEQHRTGQLLSGNVRNNSALVPAFVLNIESKTGTIEVEQMGGK